MSKKPAPRIKTIHSLDEIPDHFESEDEERDWWAEHDFSKELYQTLPDLTPELDEMAPLKKEDPKSKRRAS